MYINKLSCTSYSVNPSTPRHICRGLPFDKLKAPSIAEGLGVDPEWRFPSPPLKAELSAVERVNWFERSLEFSILNFEF
jgi:hypothetical protein